MIKHGFAGASLENGRKNIGTGRDHVLRRRHSPIPGHRRDRLDKASATDLTIFSTALSGTSLHVNQPWPRLPVKVRC